MTVNIYGSDKDFGYVCTVTLTYIVGDMTWVKVMSYFYFMDNNSMK